MLYACAWHTETEQAVTGAMRVQELEHTSHREKMTEVEQLNTELLDTMSHELRSPLAAIKGYTATLLRYDKRLRREEQREFLEAIRDAADDLSIIVDRLLEMAQLETNAIQLRCSPVDMLHLATEAIDCVEHSRQYIQATSVLPGFFTFRLNVTDEQGWPTDSVPLVWADQRRIREVLDNILENAMKFSPEGGTINVTLRPITPRTPENTQRMNGEQSALSALPSVPDIPMLEITIQDHGMGIANEHLERIFDSFQRIDTRLTREVNGLGLGLALCKHLVALHHGYLWVKSVPGAGSTFYIWLPLAQLAQPQTTES
ncbi:MAG TPA: HAMP domain-containing sensor histidine kinase [Ktedonobacteraceae bacterium]|nr:HAMP domain-containing sensor histidine kinase [Ktedonobacteraceae bacterium]